MNRQSPSSDAKKRIGTYLSRCGYQVKLKRYLGGGTDGDVWESNRKSAIKIFSHERGYYNERDTYLRLQYWEVLEQICGFWVPRMLGHADDLMIVKMEMMHNPPYIIDFAKVRLDRPPDFPADVLREFEVKGQEEFAHNWPRVKLLLHALESFQIYYLDPKRGNITFPDMPF